MPPPRRRRRAAFDEVPFTLLEEEEADQEDAAMDDDDADPITTPLLKGGLVVDRTVCGLDRNYAFAGLLMLPSALLLRLTDEVMWYMSHGGVDVDDRPHSKSSYLDYLETLRQALEEPGNQRVFVAREDRFRFEHTAMKWGDKVPNTGDFRVDHRVLGSESGRPLQSMAVYRAFMEDVGVTKSIHGHMDQVNFAFFPDEMPSADRVLQPWTAKSLYPGSVMLDPNCCGSLSACDVRLPDDNVDVMITSTATFSKFSPSYLSRTCYLCFEGDSIDVRLLDAERENGAEFQAPRDAGDEFYTVGFDFWEVVEDVAHYADDFQCKRGAVPKDIDLARLFDTKAVEEAMRFLRDVHERDGIRMHDVYYDIVDARQPEGEEAPAMGIIVGDLHSSLVSLCLILVHVREELFSKDRDGIFTERMVENGYSIFLGDMVDRGPYGVEILVLLARLLQANPGQCFLLNGNHETCGMFTRSTRKGVNTGVNPMSLGEEGEAKLGYTDAFAYDPVD